MVKVQYNRLLNPYLSNLSLPYFLHLYNGNIIHSSLWSYLEVVEDCTVLRKAWSRAHSKSMLVSVTTLINSATEGHLGGSIT